MQGQSICIVLLMASGIYFRRQKNIHIKIMSTAMIWDILLILQIELSRSAVLKASKAMSNSATLNIHVAIAVTTVVLYGLMIHSGRKLLQGQQTIRGRHRFLGWTTFVMRILTLLTSFLAVTPEA